MIKADGPKKVKESLVLTVITGLFLTSVFCAAVEVSEKDVQTLEEQEYGVAPRSPTVPKPQVKKIVRPPEDHQASSEPEAIKPIEAEEFIVRVKRKSRSGRVLLLEDPAGNQPRPGRILLLKQGQSEFAAIRVLKNYPGRFAGKIVLNFQSPTIGGEFRALKKLGYKIMEMIREREARGKDLDLDKSDEDLAREVAPDDNELDRGIPKPKPVDKNALAKQKAPKKKQTSDAERLFDETGNELLSPDSIEVKDDEDSSSETAVQENLPLEPLHHAVSLQYGAMRNVDKDNNPATYSGFGGRYAFNVVRRVLLKSPKFQDMLTGELGLFYYSISGFSEANDGVTVLPVVLTARYNVLVGETFTFFAYGGLIKNMVSADENATNQDYKRLGRTKAALGLGGMMRIGPHWAARVDFGTDMLGIGAVLKF